MFYYVTLTQNIDLEPRWFGKQLHRTLKQKLVEKVQEQPGFGSLAGTTNTSKSDSSGCVPLSHVQVEGTCTNKYGYIVNVVDVGKISQVGTPTGWQGAAVGAAAAVGNSSSR
jgi:DNA-directed RNA polymerase subunit E'/Rpb7